MIPFNPKDINYEAFVAYLERAWIQDKLWMDTQGMGIQEKGCGYSTTSFVSFLHNIGAYNKVTLREVKEVYDILEAIGYVGGPLRPSEFQEKCLYYLKA